MRIVQIIDSLDVGGAEMMAVNYANGLSEKIEFSGIVVTRKEGSLKENLDKKVHYLFLNRQGKVGWSAVWRLKAFCKKNKVGFAHAHSSSFFTASLLKLIHPKIKLIWHDHYGLSEFLASRPKLPLQITSHFFFGIISVNNQLKDWAIKNLHCKNVIYLPNFSSDSYSGSEKTILNGISGKRIVCVANLRPQKNHFLLLKVAQKLKLSHPDWTFHLIGKDFNDDYSTQIKTLISSELKNTVYIYGAKNDTARIIMQSDIGILTSDSEGLPVSLLEYGHQAKPVVVTKVGEIPKMIKNGENGFIVNPNDEQAFYDGLIALVNNIYLRKQLGNSLSQTVLEHHSENAIMAKYINWLK